MSKEAIIKRIRQDAEAEAEKLIRTAKAEAESIVSAATARAEAERAQAVSEAEERAARLLEVNAAAARLDSAKVLLAEKRRVIEEIYARALQKLLTLGEKESLALVERLLSEGAEAGDEIVLAEGYPYADGVKALPVVKERGLVVASERAPVVGGLVLRGVRCDKDLSFKTLLDADMDAHQAELAAKLFK